MFITLILGAMVFISCKKNNPPDVPSTPGGPSFAQINDTCSFVTSTIDPDGDDISYRFYWGDGHISDWSNFVPNEKAVTMSKSWATAGTYSVKAQAKDKHGATSDWSSGHQITISGGNGEWHLATSSAGWSARSRHTSVVFDNKILVLGGRGHDGSFKNDVWYWP